MADTTTIRRGTRGGVPGWVDDETGRWFPIMAGAEGDGDGADGAADGAADGGTGNGDADGADAGAGDGDDDDRISRGDDWQAKARKHERQNRKLARQVDELSRALREREDADKTEQERAIDDARRQAREEALSEAQKERRADRLESATTRLAVKGVEVKIDGRTETVRFADADDAIVYIERGIAHGDIDADEIFDADNKVRPSALTEALADILASRSHLRAGTQTTTGRPTGDADAGRGNGASGDVDMNAVIRGGGR